MREILFRGKTAEGRWVEGVYFKHDTVKVCFSSDDPKPRHLIIRDDFCDWGFEPPIHCVDVAPNTVGQYTGLTDKNGRKIFEGDILLYGGVQKVVVAFEYGQFVINHYAINLLRSRNTDSEVIGNIHDNPELLD